MDPHLDTRGSNDLGGAMFKGEHVRVLLEQATFPFNGSPTFLIQQKGEKESKSVKIIQEMLKASPNYKAKSYIKGALCLRYVW